MDGHTRISVIGPGAAGGCMHTSSPTRSCPANSGNGKTARRGDSASHTVPPHTISTGSYNAHPPGNSTYLLPRPGPASGLPPAAQPPREQRITARETREFRKNGDGPAVVLTTATFDGRLRVTDSDLPREKPSQRAVPGQGLRIRSSDPRPTAGIQPCLSPGGRPHHMTALRQPRLAPVSTRRVVVVHPGPFPRSTSTPVGLRDVVGGLLVDRCGQQLIMVGVWARRYGRPGLGLPCRLAAHIVGSSVAGPE
ncbi:hypothetical protein SAMN05216266_12059 [Amycolatopsis marina]|uniref:Uncharacterized protein n=1 Tax=Amycolatopsis marina TaxID=490629 RepID=A0A1I1C7T6_9PSEU|nr:hypothetical protein SAMN05216266_12059 [Amycolatopsis marina]